jgi:hypothetical protein
MSCAISVSVGAFAEALTSSSCLDCEFDSVVMLQPYPIQAGRTKPLFHLRVQRSSRNDGYYGTGLLTVHLLQRVGVDVVDKSADAVAVR